MKVKINPFNLSLIKFRAAYWEDEMYLLIDPYNKLYFNVSNSQDRSDWFEKIANMLDQMERNNES